MLRSFKVIGGSALAFALLLAVATQWPTQGTAAAAQAQRQVLFNIASNYEPVVITKVTLANTVVQTGRFIKPATDAPDATTPFQADDDWIQNLAVHLLNRTNKPIVYAMLNFSFPETLNGHMLRGYPLSLGRIPQPADFDRNGSPLRQRPGLQPILFRPHQTMVIALADYIDRIKANVEPVIPLATAMQVKVHLIAFYFADGMKWDGAFRTPDRQNFTWTKMDRNYFPGDVNLNWPGRPGWIDPQ
ncbi:exported hypothetical protein [Candidatus Sulfopaludibacter sp. SbA4]|nr:exported hypothetical protein [Candidatus Sulfopaludibacter sp. SbA4]